MATFSLDSAISGVSNAAATLNGANPITQEQQASYQSNGFLLASTPSADGNGLPFTKIAPGANAQIRRNIITWFVPQFGTVQMFVNPEKIVYHSGKIIKKEMTKGGFTLQYWGEDLSSLDISGTTGSSGIEGINMLHEIYRAEQYAFDATGLTLAANNAATDASSNLSNQVISNVASYTSSLGNTLNSVLGMSSPTNMLSARNIPSLASLAFAVEMYYGGIVYRGYFENMTVNEQASDFLFHYDMKFVVTQQRGYRTNFFPWNESPASGPSQYTTPPSFSGSTILNTNTDIQIANVAGGSISGLLSSLL